MALSSYLTVSIKNPGLLHRPHLLDTHNTKDKN